MWKPFPSDKLVNEVKKEYKDFKQSNAEKIYKDVSIFYSEGEAKYQQDPKTKEISTKFMTTVDKYVYNHRNEYGQSGLLTYDGKIDTNVHNYIQTERKLLKDKYRSTTLSVADMDKLMKLSSIDS